FPLPATATCQLFPLSLHDALPISSFVENANRAAQMFQASTGLIDGNIGTLRALSDSTLSQIADIANRFEDHGRVLASASELIGKDRKSTRLNSSHVKISYAVFCLK